MAYSIYKRIFGSERFQSLAAKGARPQRVLWASTGTKNPDYSDVKYVEALIGPDTINTLPPETLDAYRDHGDPAPRLEEGLDQAAGILQRLPELGIDLDQVTQQLEDEGIEKFNNPYDSLMRTLEAKRRAATYGKNLRAAAPALDGNHMNSARERTCRGCLPRRNRGAVTTPTQRQGDPGFSLIRIRLTRPVYQVVAPISCLAEASPSLCGALPHRFLPGRRLFHPDISGHRLIRL